MCFWHLQRFAWSDGCQDEIIGRLSLLTTKLHDLTIMRYIYLHIETKVYGRPRWFY